MISQIARLSLFFSLLILLALVTGRMAGLDALLDPFHNPAMPGTARPGGDGWRCVSDFEFTSSPSFFYCSLEVLGDAHLRWVVAQGTLDTIQRTGYSVRLRYGDLVSLWGRPARIGGTRRGAILYWAGIRAYVRPHRDGSLPMTAVVRYVAFAPEVVSA